MIKITASEAIRRIKTHIEIHSKRERQAVLITAALNMAVEALEKQIPKKVKLMQHGLIGEKFWFYCPTCGASRHSNNKWRYCNFCGQALDWEGAKEELEKETEGRYEKEKIY